MYIAKVYWIFSLMLTSAILPFPNIDITDAQSVQTLKILVLGGLNVLQ